VANDLQMNDSTPIAGLGTFAHTITAEEAGMITVEVQSTLPRDPGGTSLNSGQVSPFASALQIVVQQNSTPMLTIGGVATDPSPNQATLGSSVRLQCVATDLIEVVLSSVNAIDQKPNSVKSTISLFQCD
jgi:hypothetical protein